MALDRQAQEVVDLISVGKEIRENDFLVNRSTLVRLEPLKWGFATRSKGDRSATIREARV